MWLLIGKAIEEKFYLQIIRRTASLISNFSIKKHRKNATATAPRLTIQELLNIDGNNIESIVESWACAVQDCKNHVKERHS